MLVIAEVIGDLTGQLQPTDPGAADQLRDELLVQAVQTGCTPMIGSCTARFTIPNYPVNVQRQATGNSDGWGQMAKLSHDWLTGLNTTGNAGQIVY